MAAGGGFSTSDALTTRASSKAIGARLSRTLSWSSEKPAILFPFVPRFEPNPLAIEQLKKRPRRALFSDPRRSKQDQSLREARPHCSEPAPGLLLVARYKRVCFLLTHAKS